MHTSQLPFRTQRTFDEENFQQLMAARLRQSPCLFVSVGFHAVLLALIWLLVPGEPGQQPIAQIAVQDTTQEVVEQPEPPKEPEVQPEEDLELAPVDDPVIADTTAENDAFAEADSAEPSTPSALDSNQWNTALGMNGGAAAGPYSGRGNGGAGGAGGRQTPLSVRRGLEWLAAHQDDDGRWDADGFMKHDLADGGEICDGPGNAVHDVGVTGLALLAFLGDGSTMRAGPYKQNIKKGVTWLRKQQQENGLFGMNASHDFVYDHAIAAYAMCEAFGLSNYKLLKKTAQKGINYLESHRNPYSVWRYQPRDNDNDISVTGWCIMAYESGEFFGLQINKSALAMCETFLDQVSDATGKHGYTKQGEGSSRKPGDHATKFPIEKGEALTAVGLFCRFFMNQDPKEKPIMKASADLLRSKPPIWDEKSGTIDHYYWYYATYALYQYGGAHWNEWKKKLETSVVKNQHRDAGEKNKLGSWDPIGAWGEDGGRVYSTAILVLTLEAYYRYSRLVR